MSASPHTIERPSTTAGDNTDRVAHYYCAVDDENGVDRGLCGHDCQGRPAKHRDQVCVICDDVVRTHRAQCPPCVIRWGSEPSFG